MKKRVRVLICLIMLIFVLPVCVFAGAYPEKMDIVADVNRDGSMTVTETITWEIEESINGVYRDVLCFNPGNKLNSANEIYVHKVLVDGKEYYHSEELLENGDSGMYNLNRIENGVQIKIFHPSDEYRVKTILEYTLTDVVVEYSDVAELYWNFIGKGWAGGVEDAKITINLPDISNELKIFGHGPLDGYSEILEDQTLVFHIPYLRSGEAVDARVLFDTDIVHAAKFQDKPMYETIMANELELAKEADARRARAEMFAYVCWIISGITVVVIVSTYIWAISKAKKSNVEYRYYRELPEDYGVPVMNYLLYKYHKPNENMLATLMDLVRKKYVKIYPVTQEGKTKPVDYELKLINEDLSKLNKVEQHYIKELIFVGCNSIRLKELKKKNTASTTAREMAGKAFDKWQELIEKEYKACKLERKDTKKVITKAIVILSLCFVPLFIIFLVASIMENFYAAVPVGLVLFPYIFVFIWMVMKLPTKLSDNEKALEHKAKWKGFKRFLKHFSKMEEKDYGSIILWEHYLVYAIGLGIADKVLKQLKDIYPEITELEDTYSGIYHSSTYHSFSSSFNSVSTGAFTYSSSTGSGGGFSGGGGGRRRRWRRRRILIRAQHNK